MEAQHKASHRRTRSNSLGLYVYCSMKIVGLWLNQSPAAGLNVLVQSTNSIFQLQKPVGRCAVQSYQQNLPSVESRTSKDCCQRDRRCVAFLRNLLMASVSAVQIKRWGSSPTPALERSPSQSLRTFGRCKALYLRKEIF